MIKVDKGRWVGEDDQMFEKKILNVDINNFANVDKEGGETPTNKK